MAQNNTIHNILEVVVGTADIRSSNQEEDEDGTTEWRQLHLRPHNLVQAIYAHVHSDISLADVILGVFV